MTKEGGMHMRIGLDPVPKMSDEQRLAKETPIYSLLRLGKFHKEIIQDLAENSTRHYVWFILGHVSAGKEVVTKNILYRQLYDPAIRRMADPLEAQLGYPIDLGLLSTPMNNWLGREEGSILHPIGKFHHAAQNSDVEASDAVGDRTLNDRYLHARKPALDIVEGGFFGHPYWPFTTNMLRCALDRSQQDPDYIVKATVVIPEKQIQKRGMMIRRTIAEAPTPADAETITQQAGVIFDVNLARENFVSSWGNDNTVLQHEILGDLHALHEQDTIRKIDKKIPKYTFRQLLEDPTLWMKVHVARMRMVLEQEFGMRKDDFRVRKNPYRADLEIPFQRGFGNEYALIPAPWTQVQPKD